MMVCPCSFAVEKKFAYVLWYCRCGAGGDEAGRLPKTYHVTSKSLVCLPACVSLIHCCTVSFGCSLAQFVHWWFMTHLSNLALTLSTGAQLVSLMHIFSKQPSHRGLAYFL